MIITLLFISKALRSPSGCTTDHVIAFISLFSSSASFSILCKFTLFQQMIHFLSDVSISAPEVLNYRDSNKYFKLSVKACCTAYFTSVCTSSETVLYKRNGCVCKGLDFETSDSVNATPSNSTPNIFLFRSMTSIERPSHKESLKPILNTRLQPQIWSSRCSPSTHHRFTFVHVSSFRVFSTSPSEEIYLR